MCKVVRLYCLFYGCADPTSDVRLLSCTVLTSTVRVQSCMSLLFVLQMCRPSKCCSFVGLYGADEYCSCAKLYVSIVYFTVVQTLQVLFVC